MNHFATPAFWFHYRRLPESIRTVADKNFELLRNDPFHPSLRFKQVGEYRSVRIGLHYRALAKERVDGIVWFWIGHHSEYDELIKNQ